MKDIKAVISDLDGTLLLSNSQIGAFSELVIKKLTKENKKFIIATGRSKNEIISLITNLNSHVSFFITLNGARVYNNQWQLISSYDLSSEIVTEILNLRENKYKDIPHFLQKSEDIDERLYADNITKNAINNMLKKQALLRRNYKYIEHELKDIDIKYHGINHFREIKNFNNIAKILLLHDEEPQLIKYEAMILEKYKKEINVYLSTPYSLEIVNSKVSKGNALKDVLKRINISLNEAIAFGDGFNDVDMLENVKKGLLMGNANYRLKKILSYLEIIDTNDNEAVANYINENILEDPVQ
ncbi:Cof-type HAD-IIB family hydrolase [Borrelia anserina]|uniref:Hydrolase (HAD superfamily) n=2 Tax=Borrelia anserina TaxID=143 RepID=W5SMD3_BORAN|nr:Cof-type HAD-IIB family hydrolase [Borrelia anserina]AHH08030.1 Hydrolase (HAD superfamily) [Borrelia anserina BA2]APR64580.1 haloacid dehalogenase [Borrelia anserina Es]UPA06493.1 Cof-type HAD-IIB family hydrolase [Borrelia anserina]